MMKQGGDLLDAGVTDQYRVYSYIVSALEQRRPLRLMVQASAGTGKSFLLTTVYLWCLVHEKRTKATDSFKIVPEPELVLGGGRGNARCGLRAARVSSRGSSSNRHRSRKHRDREDGRGRDYYSQPVRGPLFLFAPHLCTHRPLSTLHPPRGLPAGSASLCPQVLYGRNT